MGKLDEFILAHQYQRLHFYLFYRNMPISCECPLVLIFSSSETTTKVVSQEFCLFNCQHNLFAKISGITVYLAFALIEVLTMFLQTRQTALFSATQTSKVFFCWLLYGHYQYLLFLMMHCLILQVKDLARVSLTSPVHVDVDDGRRKV